MRPHLLAFAALTLSTAFAVSACDAILGIEDAQLDPLLGTGGGGQPPGNLCEQYCATITANCDDDDIQYSTEENCNQVCPNLPGFNNPDTIGDTVGCRLENAEQAGVIGADECPTAGPGSEGACGDNCTTFCLLFEKACGTEPVDLFDYANQAACRADCASFPDMGPFSAELTTDGDTVQCRLYHVSQAFVDAAFHCEHAAGISICVDGTGGAGTGGAGGTGGAPSTSSSGAGGN